MELSDFNYELPMELIAQRPARRREDARLMFVERETGAIRHLKFCDLPELLGATDLLVLNRTLVFPARLIADATTKPIEVLLVRDLGNDDWEALIKPGKKAPPGKRLVFHSGKLEAVVLEGTPNSPVRLIHFEYDGDFWTRINSLGRVPLPPYIRRDGMDAVEEDRRRYQTVFARDRGSVAAPTAGLHFTPDLLERVRHCFLTLHVGYGTFRPVTAPRIEEHRMDAEFYRIETVDADRIMRCRTEGGRILAVGTTTTRALEHVWRERGEIVPEEGWTDLYIYPGFQFQVIEGLVTNFHLPRSTLLILVSAFAGLEFIRECYRKAIELRYRFYSYGDAMFIA